MSGYTVNITNTKNDSLLYDTTIPNHLENNTVAAFFTSSLLSQSSTYQACDTLRISASAINVVYGESESTQIDVQLLKGINAVLTSKH